MNAPSHNHAIQRRAMGVGTDLEATFSSPMALADGKRSAT
jgi:hypothetical protein